MAKYSMKIKGKEVGPASTYAGRAEEAIPDLAARANMGNTNTLNPSIGNISKDPEAPAVKTTGIKMRGAGAATKGTMCRGPMA